MSNYLIHRDHKYISREWRNGRWRYTYNHYDGTHGVRYGSAISNAAHRIASSYAVRDAKAELEAAVNRANRHIRPNTSTNFRLGKSDKSQYVTGKTSKPARRGALTNTVKGVLDKTSSTLHRTTDTSEKRRQLEEFRRKMSTYRPPNANGSSSQKFNSNRKISGRNVRVMNNRKLTSVNRRPLWQVIGKHKKKG